MECLALLQMINEIIELVDEKLRRPEISSLAGQQGRIATTQLVVMDDGAALQTQELIGINIIMGPPGPPCRMKTGFFFALRSPDIRYQVSYVPNFARPSTDLIPTTKTSSPLPRKRQKLSRRSKSCNGAAAIDSHAWNSSP